MNFDSLISSIIATVVGGGILAVLFFWVRERLFPLSDVSGTWYIEMRTINTAYKPYMGMVLRYVVMIWCEGNRIQGTVEKIYENSTTGEREFVGENRTRGVAEGYLEKNYFTKDRLFLHVVENGHGRESTYFFDAIIKSNKKMVGAFNSMVADQDGEVTWQRDVF